MTGFSIGQMRAIPNGDDIRAVRGFYLSIARGAHSPHVKISMSSPAPEPNQLENRLLLANVATWGCG